jgi:hypothetical protein
MPLPSLPHRPGPAISSFTQRLGGAIAAAVLALGLPLQVQAQSALLESVKKNPALAQSLCQQFRQLNAQGVSATAPGSIATLARSQGLSTVDAEVLATYVIGLHCSNVF